MAQIPAQPNAYVDAVAGASAGIVSRLASAPFDVLKIRMQLSTSAVTFSTVGGAGSIGDLARLAARIARNEGLLAFWAGNLPALQLYCVYNAVQVRAFATPASSRHVLRLGATARPRSRLAPACPRC
jgi:solute carrier family 25 thiamine pyrophosphate transporter 19